MNYIVDFIKAVKLCYRIGKLWGCKKGLRSFLFLYKELFRRIINFLAGNKVWRQKETWWVKHNNKVGVHIC